MDESTDNVECKILKKSSHEDNLEDAENLLPISTNVDPLNSIHQDNNSENQTSTEATDVGSQNTIVAETSSNVASDNSMPPLPPLPKEDKGSTAQYSADYNMQNYANYSYMYNYNNYYGYPYPQYQWDYNSQQYYQPYQNYYNYNYNSNSNQTQTSKPPPPPPDAVQLPVEEKPCNKTNATIIDDPNRYSPTAETDDDDNIKGLSENIKSDALVEQATRITTSVANPNQFQTVLLEQVEIKQNMLESVDKKVHQSDVPSIAPVHQNGVPLIAKIQPYNIPVQQPNYLINPHIQMQSAESISELMNQPQVLPILNGKDEVVEKVTKGSTVLGKTQAKKRLMAFSMMKQKLQEQNTINDNPNSDIGEGNDVEFIPELNVFQTVTKKKVITNKKVVKVIKAQQTIEQIEEMKKDELMQGNNAALYQHLLRSGGNEAPILQKLGIESLAEKYSAKIREQDKRLKRHHHRRRDDNRRSHKYRRHSHSKSRSRSRSVEKPKMRALEVKSWKDFVNGGFNFDKFRRFKLDEAEEMKENERKSRTKKRHGSSRSDGKKQNTEFTMLTEVEKGNGDQKLRYNILDSKKIIRKGLEVMTHVEDFTKDFPSYIIRYTKSKPVVTFSENPERATFHLQNRQQMFATLPPEIEVIVLKFLSAMKPKKLKENLINSNFNCVDDKLLMMMKDKNIYPFKGWWPKSYFIITHIKDDPNVVIDTDALINEISISKRTKKSRFNDDISLVDIRPTVPSKWDSDYDESPAVDKVVDVEVPQNLRIKETNDNRIINREEFYNPLDTSHHEDAMDIASDIDEDVPKTIGITTTLPTQSEEPQRHAKLDTEYEEFLKVVSADKIDNTFENEIPTSSVVQKDNENDQSMKSASLIDESVQDESEEDTSTKSSDESGSLYNAEKESMDRSFVKTLSGVDKKLKKKKKKSSKKSKKFKKKDGKKKKHVTSSSESSQDSKSESDSSSEDSESESTDDSSFTAEKKKKKKKTKDKKKKKVKNNYRKKHKSEKNKIKKSENVKDNNSSILNLLEKAFNVEIKKKPSSDESKQKKKKRKHEKKEIKTNVENEDKLKKVKECLKETFTKLVKTDQVSKKQSLSCDDSAVNEVLKYLKMDDGKEKKKKKSKKSSKRKHDSDNSDEEKTPKKFRLSDGLKSELCEKKKKSKKKKSVDSDQHVSKDKSKKKLKASDTSEIESEEEAKHKIIEREDSENFFGLRPNEWNINIKSSTRGVAHHSVITNNELTTNEFSGFDSKIKTSKSLYLNVDNLCPTNSENPNSPSIYKEIKKGPTEKQLKMYDEIMKDNNVLKHIGDNTKMNLNKYDNESGNEDKHDFESDKILNIAKFCDVNVVENTNSVLQTSLNNKEQDSDIDFDDVAKPTQHKSLVQNDGSTANTIIKPSVPVEKPISYRDLVKMNLKKLSNLQNIPFGFGFSPSLSEIKPKNLTVETFKENIEVVKERVMPRVDELKLSEFDRPKLVICPQLPKKKSSVTEEIACEIDNETDKVFVKNLSKEDLGFEQSFLVNTNISEQLNNVEESEQVESSLVENKPLHTTIKNYQCENEIFSNNSELKKQEHILSNLSETIINSDLKNKEQELHSEVENIVVKEIVTSINWNKSISEQNVEPNTEVSQNNASLKIMSPEKNNSCSVNNLKCSKLNSELINQWESDWSNLDKSIIDIDDVNKCRLDNPNKLRTKRKSRWDKKPVDEKINESQSSIDENEMLKDEMNNSATDELKNISLTSNREESVVDLNETCEITSIDHDHNSTGYSEGWHDEYGNYFQSYDNQYSCIPQYSEMKTIDNGQLSPIDYTIYENYNPNYNYNDVNCDMSKSSDTFNCHQSIEPVANETSTIQVGNVLEILPSDNISNDEAEISNKSIQTIIPDAQQKIKTEKSDEQFFQLYQQHFQHYNQNPIKYSMCDPILDSITEVNFSDLERSPLKENLNADKENDKMIPIPLQDRGYSCLICDGNTNIYITSDNYIAYCAVEDRCMVHIAVDSICRAGIKDEVRHCFNINLNGTVDEYWLHADLIPFHNSSDAESGVFCDEEDSVVESDISKEDDTVDCNDDSDNYDVIEGEWDIVHSYSDNKNSSWLNNPHIIEKYGTKDDAVVGKTVTASLQDENMLSSSDDESYDTNYDLNTMADVNRFPQTCFKTSSVEKKNITVKPFQRTLETSDNENDSHNVNETMSVVVTGQMENVSTTNSNVESDENVTMFDRSVSNTLVKNDLMPEVNTKEDNIVMNIKEKNTGVPEIEEIKIEDLCLAVTIANQQQLIRRCCEKNKIQEKLSDTIMIQYSDNVETVKHPFLGLFQPPTISILSKKRCTETCPSKLSKRVTFADGINPGEDVVTSLTHSDFGRPLSPPPPFKKLIKESLKLKHNMYPFKMTKVRTKVTMVKDRKVAKVLPFIKTATPSVIEYYISRQHVRTGPVPESISSILHSVDSQNRGNDHNRNVELELPSRLPPAMLDEHWNDDEQLEY